MHVVPIFFLFSAGSMSSQLNRIGEKMRIKIKYIQISLLTSVILYGHSVQANKIPEELRDFNHRTYNALPLSAEADLELNKNGNLNKFLEDATPVAEKYNLSDSIGFRLLHRHEILEEGKVMVESFGHWRELPAFITTPEKEDTPKTYPASWAYDTSGLKVFEFSTDPEVKKVAKQLGVHRGFFEEMKEVLVKHQLEKILAPAVLLRNSFVHFDRTQPLYEIIESQPYTSVLINKSQEELDQESEKGKKLIRTTWPLGTNNPNETICAVSCSTEKSMHVYEEHK